MRTCKSDDEGPDQGKNRSERRGVRCPLLFCDFGSVSCSSFRVAQVFGVLCEILYMPLSTSRSRSPVRLVALPPDRMEITVRIHLKKWHSFEVDSEVTTVGDVKSVMRQWRGDSRHGQWNLFSRGRLLQDGCTLASYDIHSGANDIHSGASYDIHSRSSHLRLAHQRAFRPG